MDARLPHDAEGRRALTALVAAALGLFIVGFRTVDVMAGA